MKLLLHTCCAPCVAYPAKEARKDGFEITGLFYNPNIHPHPEHERRQAEVKKYFKEEALELICIDHDPAAYFRESAQEDPRERCFSCWKLRLRETASMASEKGFDAFTSTLLGSPYQDEKSLRNISNELSRERAVTFYYKDFRRGFAEAHRSMKERGVYCQNYCGCVFSLVEREERKKSRKKECTV